MRDIKAKNEAVIQGKHYRFTVLTPCLIRMEYSESGKFVDQATQTVVNRTFPVPQFRLEETDCELKIVTSKLRLTYNKKPFSSVGLKINISGNFPGILPVWHYGDAVCDLKGTARTLDGADGAIPLETGILSAQGFSLLDDGGTMLLDENGWIASREDADGKDLYFFGYGRDYITCLRDFHILTGEVPLLPKFALGNWWSRYYKYTEESYLRLMDRFAQEEIPFTVSVLDMDWHITDVDPKYGTGWTGYTWNLDMFPDPKRFMDKLHEKGLKVTLNVHPADGIRAFEDCYKPFADYMGVLAEQEDPIPFQPGDEKFMKGYFDYVHHPMEKQGVDFWWIDWQQGNNSGIEGLDPLWVLNHYHYEDSRRSGKRGLIFSRYAGPGSHRYPVGFSGDSVITWESLDFQPYFTATASNIGYGWWSHDIGGHMQGIKNDELAVRWLQFGVFSPIMRLHSTCNEFNGKEPWRYNSIAENIMKKYLRLRHKLIPYLNTMNLRANQESMPLIQPMYYHNPLQEEAYHVPNEYYFGSELIVCPITSPVDKRTGMAKFAAWLPDGIWVDFFTGVTYEGGRNVDFYRGIDKIPLLARRGSIVPLDGRETGNELTNTDILELHVFAGDSGEFCLWEDDSDAAEFDQNSWAKTKIQYHWGENARLTIHRAQGNLQVLPSKRAYRICLAGMKEGCDPKVLAGGRKLKGISSKYCAEIGFTWIEIPEIDVTEDVIIEMNQAAEGENQIVQRIFDFLNQAEIEFDLKTRIISVVRQLETGKKPVYVLGQLQAMDQLEELMGPLWEIITAFEE